MKNIDIAERFRAATDAMRQMWDGPTLQRAAAQIAAEAPDGRVVFASTSTEGTALAAVCAAIRGDGSSWRHVNLLAPAELTAPIVFVEPVFPGQAWLQAVERVYPHSIVIIPSVVDAYADSLRPAASAAAAA